MDLSHYVEQLRGGLAASAAAGGEAVVDAAERLSTALDAAVRMVLLEALSDAAAEITTVLDGPSVDLRLKGLDPDFVVTPGALPEPASDASAPPSAADGGADDDAATARVTLRLPEALKQRAEVAAG